MQFLFTMSWLSEFHWPCSLKQFNTCLCSKIIKKPRFKDQLFTKIYLYNGKIKGYVYVLWDFGNHWGYRSAKCDGGCKRGTENVSMVLAARVMA